MSPVHEPGSPAPEAEHFRAVRLFINWVLYSQRQWELFNVGQLNGTGSVSESIYPEWDNLKSTFTLLCCKRKSCPLSSWKGKLSLLTVGSFLVASAVPAICPFLWHLCSHPWDQLLGTHSGATICLFNKPDWVKFIIPCNSVQSAPIISLVQSLLLTVQIGKIPFGANDVSLALVKTRGGGRADTDRSHPEQIRELVETESWVPCFWTVKPQRAHAFLQMVHRFLTFLY